MGNKKFNALFLAVVALLFVGGIAGATYSYWAGTVKAPTATLTQGVSVTVGTGAEVSTTLTLSESNTGTLVPAGRAGTGQVEYVISTITATWSEDITELATGHAGTLAATVSNVEIGGADTYEDLVVTAVQIGGTVTGGTFNEDGSTDIALDGAAVPVYVKVTLTEPATQAVYRAVAGKDITFNVNFTVTPSTN